MFTRDLFHRVRRFPIFVLVGGGRHFRLGQSFVARFTSLRGRHITKTGQHAEPTVSFPGQVLVYSHFQLHREIIGAQVVLSIKCIGCVLFRCWLFVHWAGHRNCVASALTRTSRVFPTRVFSKMHKMSSVALPACCLPRNNPFSSILGTFS